MTQVHHSSCREWGILATPSEAGRSRRNRAISTNLAVPRGCCSAYVDRCLRLRTRLVHARKGSCSVRRHCGSCSRREDTSSGSPLREVMSSNTPPPPPPLHRFSPLRIPTRIVAPARFRLTLLMLIPLHFGSSRHVVKAFVHVSSSQATLQAQWLSSGTPYEHVKSGPATMVLVANSGGGEEGREGGVGVVW